MPEALPARRRWNEPWPRLAGRSRLLVERVRDAKPQDDVDPRGSPARSRRRAPAPDRARARTPQGARGARRAGSRGRGGRGVSAPRARTGRKPRSQGRPRRAAASGTTYGRGGTRLPQPSGWRRSREGRRSTSGSIIEGVSLYGQICPPCRSPVSEGAPRASGIDSPGSARHIVLHKRIDGPTIRSSAVPESSFAVASDINGRSTGLRGVARQTDADQRDAAPLKRSG